MALGLLVVFNQVTGYILAVRQGGIIRKRKQLLKYAPKADLSELSFYYEESNTPIVIGEDKVSRISRNQAPLLIDKFDTPKAFLQFIKNRREMVKGATSVVIEVEWGMGDQIMAGEAARALQEEYPELKIYLAANVAYHEILKYVSPLPELIRPSFRHPDPKSVRIGLNPTHKLWDPRGPPFGKSSFYGAHLGLEKVDQRVNFCMPGHDIIELAKKAGVNLFEIHRPLLGLHVISNSRLASQWDTGRAMEVAKKWNDETGGDVFLIGDSAFWPAYPKYCFTIDYKSNWVTTGALILALDLFVGIDSGPMHLARAGDIPSIILWGGSGPLDILGREETEIDLRADLPCINNLCAACVLPTAACMEMIEAKHVWAAIEKNWPEVVEKGRNAKY